MDLQPIPKIESPDDIRKYLGALGIHAMETLHTRLVANPDSPTKLMLDFADLALKAGDLYPKANTSLLNAQSGATINFHFSKPPPNHVASTVTYDHEALPVPDTTSLPEPSLELQALALELNSVLDTVANGIT